MVYTAWYDTIIKLTDRPLADRRQDIMTGFDETTSAKADQLFDIWVEIDKKAAESEYKNDALNKMYDEAFLMLQGTYLLLHICPIAGSDSRQSLLDHRVE